MESEETKVFKNTAQITKKAKMATQKSTRGFIKFLQDQGVAGLAIGFIIGAQARIVVDQFNASFVDPLLGLIIGSPDGLNNQTFTISLGDNTAEFAWGAFAYAFINFIIVSLIVYVTYKMLHLNKFEKPKK